jgi:sialic acid synthase SpsE
MRDLAIGPSHPVLIIAEIGVNHDGSLATALSLLRAAKKCGADAVKLQLFRADRLMHASTGFAAYQKGRVKDDSPIAMLKRYELSDADVRKLAAEATKLKLWLIATPFSPGDLPLIDSLDIPAIKIASPDLVNKPLLREAAKLGRPMLISTGAATMDEIDRTISWLVEWSAPFALLHCISSYPTKPPDANLTWIGELRERYGVPIGFSDHTTELSAGALAVASGAKMIEKHLTHNRKAAGPDHAASFDSEQFAEYVRLIRLAETMLGQPGKRVLSGENDVRKVSRQSLVVAKNVAKGAKLKPDDLTVQRPGTGISAADIDDWIGRTAARALKTGEMLNPKMVKNS